MIKKIISAIINKLAPLKQYKQQIFLIGISFLIVGLFFTIFEDIATNDVNSTQRKFIGYLSSVVGLMLITIVSEKAPKIITTFLLFAASILFVMLEVILSISSINKKIPLFADYIMIVFLIAAISYLLINLSKIVKFIKSLPQNSTKQKIKSFLGILLGLSSFLSILYGILKQLIDFTILLP
ncbi:MAG: hypothetical protein ACERKZ_03335 [Lachnotalea sp.]